jgi:hypothetical protein
VQVFGILVEKRITTRSLSAIAFYNESDAAPKMKQREFEVLAEHVSAVSARSECGSIQQRMRPCQLDAQARYPRIRIESARRR